MEKGFKLRPKLKDTGINHVGKCKILTIKSSFSPVLCLEMP